MIKVVRKTTKGDISKIILSTVKATGFMGIALVAPNALSAFSKLGFFGFSKENYGQINRARNRLLKNGYLVKDDKGFVRLSSKGEDRLRKYELSDYELRIPRIWDGKWRVIIFDIPEYRKNLRDKLRRTLISIGFCKIQNSVWVFPYECEELFLLLKADFKIGKDVLYLVVDKLEGDQLFKKAFDLN